MLTKKKLFGEVLIPVSFDGYSVSDLKRYYQDSYLIRFQGGTPQLVYVYRVEGSSFICQDPSEEGSFVVNGQELFRWIPPIGFYSGTHVTVSPHRSTKKGTSLPRCQAQKINLTLREGTTPRLFLMANGWIYDLTNRPVGTYINKKYYVPCKRLKDRILEENPKLNVTVLPFSDALPPSSLFGATTDKVHNVYNTSHVEGIKFGLELEFEGVEVKKSLRKWSTHADGSLRNNGMEFITPPIELQEVEEALDEIYSKVQFTSSERCSTHVHFNVSDMEVNVFRNFLLLCAIYEPLLLRYCSPVRSQNTFCIPLSKSAAAQEAWARLLRDTAFFRRISDESLRSNYKYSAINISRMRDLGTIEFRTLEAASSKENVLMWCRLISLLHRTATFISLENILSMKENDELLSFISMNFPMEKVNQNAEDLSSASELLEIGVKTMNNILTSVELSRFDAIDYRREVQKKFPSKQEVAPQEESPK